MEKKVYSNFQWLLIKERLENIKMPKLYDQVQELNPIARAKIIINSNLYIYVFEYEKGEIYSFISFNGDFKTTELKYFHLKEFLEHLPFFIEIQEIEISLEEIKEELKVIIHNNQQKIEGF